MLLKRHILLILMMTGLLVGPAFGARDNNPIVQIKTSKGDIFVELFEKQAPVTCKNFLSYVQSGFYKGTIFHRVIKGFIIQGGGYDNKFREKLTSLPINNEATNGLKNTKGSIAMARTDKVHSATSQFFFNMADNDFLDHRNLSSQGYGYTVFGRIIKGLDVAEAIAKTRTHTVGYFSDVPIEEIIIDDVVLLRP